MTLSAADMLRARLTSEFGLEEEAITPENDETLGGIFREKPVPLVEFIYNQPYLGLGDTGFHLSEIQLDFIHHFEQVFFPETHKLMEEMWGELYKMVRYVNELVAEWGKGGGKDTVCAIAFARVAYLLLCLTNPQKYYGLGQNGYLHMLNVAATAPQAHQAFFKPLRALFVASPWFADKWASGEAPGEMATTIRFTRQIELISGHSDADNLEGKNVIAGTADEISAFPSKDDSRTKEPAKTAEGLLGMLRSSATSRFEQTYKLGIISFPRRKGDAIQQERQKAEASIEKYGDKSNKYASGPHASWDANSRFDKYERIPMPGSHFGTIPNVQSLIEQYEEDPVEARAKYECAPELSSNPYFKDKGAIAEAFSGKRSPAPLTIDYYYGIDREAGEERPSWQVSYGLHGLVPVPGALYAIHADMAVTGDRAGIAMAHVKNYREVVTSGVQGSDDMRVENRPVVTVDFVTAYEADATAKLESGQVLPREIQIRWYRKLVVMLANYGFKFVSVSMDGFQSVDSLQILAARGFEAQKISVDRTDDAWKTLRDVMYDSRLKAYEHPLVSRELEALSKPPGGKVDHPPGGSKDMADSVAASVYMAVLSGGQEEVDDDRFYADTNEAQLPYTRSGLAYEPNPGDAWGNGMFAGHTGGFFDGAPPSGIFGR